jgi:hypothetical protein
LEQIRIVLIALPRMLQEIIQEIVARDPRIKMVGEYSNPANLAAALSRPAGCHLLQPGTRTLAVLDGGGDALLLQPLAPQRVELVELTPGRLGEAFAHAADPPAQGSHRADPPSPTG